MKRIVIVFIIMTLLFALSSIVSVGCGVQGDNNAVPSEVTESISPNIPKDTELIITTDDTPETNDVNDDYNLENDYVNETPTTSKIIGTLYYKNYDISLIFENPAVDILGEPLEERGHFLFYDGLEISSFFEIVSFIQGTNLSLFELNGVSLDKTRAELIAAFGDPIEYYVYSAYVYRASDNYHMIRYHISLNSTIYKLDFWFDYWDATLGMWIAHPYDSARIFSIRRFYH